jgi:transposase
LATDSTCQSPWPRLIFRLQLWVLLQHKFPEYTISSLLGCHVKTVLMWKKRFQEGEVILDRNRSGRPKRIPSEVDNRLIAFYCQHNPLPGCTRWTIRWAQTYLEEHPQILQCPISRSSIHRMLKSHALKPYRNKYFLQISDPHFFEKMEKILKVYKRAYHYLFCLDECTGLQALQRIAPRLPQQDGRPEYLEPEYVRHGTVSILSILQVSTGHVFTDCIPNHTSSTLILSVKKHALRYEKSAVLHYICDNYSSHSTEEFCLGIAELCGVDLPKLKTAADRKQWLESPEKRIIFHFLPTHGSWLNLIEIWFCILQQKALKDESFQSTAELIKRILSFTDTWNIHFAHPFKFTYTGEGLHRKVISRFTKWLIMESPQLNVKFVAKQIELMSNLATTYWSKPKKDDWTTLKSTLQEKDDFIRGIIGGDEQLDILLTKLNNLIYTNLMAT